MLYLIKGGTYSTSCLLDKDHGKQKNKTNIWGGILSGMFVFCLVLNHTILWKLLLPNNPTHVNFQDLTHFAWGWGRWGYGGLQADKLRETEMFNIYTQHFRRKIRIEDWRMNWNNNCQQKTKVYFIWLCICKCQFYCIVFFGCCKYKYFLLAIAKYLRWDRMSGMLMSKFRNAKAQCYLE